MSAMRLLLLVALVQMAEGVGVLGFCEAAYGPGDCSGASSPVGGHHKGQLRLDSANASSCIHACRACERCNFVSFSPGFGCSWFEFCALDRLQQRPEQEWRTYQVKERPLVEQLQLSPRSAPTPNAAYIMSAAAVAADWQSSPEAARMSRRLEAKPRSSTNMAGKHEMRHEIRRSDVLMYACARPELKLGIENGQALLNLLSEPSFDSLCLGQRQAWRAVLATDKTLHPAELSMVALGGSMVKGMGCSCGTLSQEECSYGSRLADWLGGLTRRRVHFFNRAAGGSPTRGLLALLSELIRVPTRVDSERVAASGRQEMAAADVLVVDFSINDVRLKANTSPWRDMGLGNYSTYELVGAATEAVLRFILSEHASSSALLIVESNCRVAGGDGESGRAHRDVAAHYGVAFVSLPAALRRGPAACTSSAKPVVWNVHPHPDATAHAMIAHVASAVLRRFGKAAGAMNNTGTRRDSSLPARRFFSSPALRSSHQICSPPLSMHVATRDCPIRTSAACPRVVSGSWEAREDRAGKFGWISNGPEASTIEFPLRLGKLPRVTVVWMQGYDGWGRASVGFRQAPGLQMVLDGLHGENRTVTQLNSITMGVAQPPSSLLMRNISRHRGRSNTHLASNEIGWGLTRASNVTLTLTLLCESPMACGQFKLVSVSSC